jgi:transcriptional regulator with XRE-family HTH domain
MYEGEKSMSTKPPAEQADATSAAAQESASVADTQTPGDSSFNDPLATVAGDLISAGIPAQEHIAAMRDHGQALLEHMQAQSMLDRPEREQTWRGYMTMVQDVLHYIDCAGLVVPLQQEEGAVPLREMQAFGRLVRERREAAGLSRSMVAQRAKLSDATIKFIETAKTIPSRTTLFRLLRVNELGLTWADVPAARQPQDFLAVRAAAATEPAKGIEVVDPTLNFYVPPSYDAVRMIGELARLLNGAGGHVEQTNAYLDHHSAAAYLAMSRQWPILAAPRPLDVAARQICQASGDAPLTVIALGAGDGTTEVQFVRHLVACSSRPDIELCLMDISQPLLTVAYKHAADTLSDHTGVHVWCLQGNFHHLPTYPQLQYKPSTSRRRRVYCAFGGTLANIDHEPRFFRDSLSSVCGPGDFLVMDVQLARGNVEDLATVQDNDPALRTPFPKVYADWLSGPIYRCCPDVASVEFSMRLDTQCPVPGSYAVEAIATVRANQRSPRQFSMFRFKRYELSALSECMQKLGWEPLLSLPFGVGTEKTACLLLFVRVAD